jgi:hypothetical protein
LASRNILCKKEDGRWTAKVAGNFRVFIILKKFSDFGMSRLVSEESIYSTQSKVMPVRVKGNFFEIS